VSARTTASLTHDVVDPRAPGGGPEPSPSLAGLSLSSQISGGEGVGGGGDAPGAPGLPLPAVGARVRFKGLTELTRETALKGCLGRVVGHAGARALVRLDGPSGRVVNVKPQNLVVVIIGLSDVLQVPGLAAEAGAYTCSQFS